jgi:ketosteroid isomerase-like protein
MPDMKKSNSLLLPFLLALLISCRTNEKGNLGDEPSTDADRNAIADTIRLRYKQILKSIESVDADGLLSHFSKSSQFRFVGQDGDMFKSYAVFRDSARKGYAKVAYQKENSSTVDVDVFSPELAAATIIAHFDAVFKDSTRFKGFAVTTFLFRKEEGDWKIVYGHQSIKDDTTATK